MHAQPEDKGYESFWEKSVDLLLPLVLPGHIHNFKSILKLAMFLYLSCSAIFLSTGLVVTGNRHLGPVESIKVLAEPGLGHLPIKA
jgi:hypothetical protein